MSPRYAQPPEEMTLVHIVGANIAERRKKAGLTQAQIAEQLAVEKETVSRMENGKIVLNLDRLQQFATILGCSVVDLLKDPSFELQMQAEAMADMMRPLTPEEREAVVRFVGEAVRLFQTTRKE